jgi:hypothetical protein
VPGFAGRLSAAKNVQGMEVLHFLSRPEGNILFNARTSPTEVER